jgi:hypothetical protein
MWEMQSGTGREEFKIKLKKLNILFLEENRWLNIQQLNFYSSSSNCYCLPGWSGIVREVFF